MCGTKKRRVKHPQDPVGGEKVVSTIRLYMRFLSWEVASSFNLHLGNSFEDELFHAVLVV